jgi:hypothetical protein
MTEQRDMMSHISKGYRQRSDDYPPHPFFLSCMSWQPSSCVVKVSTYHWPAFMPGQPPSLQGLHEEQSDSSVAAAACSAPLPKPARRVEVSAPDLTSLPSWCGSVAFLPELCYGLTWFWEPAHQPHQPPAQSDLPAGSTSLQRVTHGPLCLPRSSRAGAQRLVLFCFVGSPSSLRTARTDTRPRHAREACLPACCQ